MHLTLSPQVGLPGVAETTLHVAGDVLTVDGTPFDLSPVPEDGEGWPEGTHPFVGRITREQGFLHCSVRITLGADAAPDQPADPHHWTLACKDGPVAIPALRSPKVPE